MRDASGAATAAYAKAAKIEIVQEYYNEAVSGADMIETWPGFMAMLERLLSNGVRTIVVETANRFARDPMVQEVGYAMLKERGHRADRQARRLPRRHADSRADPSGARCRLPVREGDAGLEAARRARSQACDRRRGEGRNSHSELRPEAVALARQLHRTQLSLREIAAELFAAGHVTKHGKTFSSSAIASMLEG